MQAFEILDVAACADIDMERAEAHAKKYGVPRACTPGEMLGDPEIDIVVNLTVPKAHAEVSLAAPHWYGLTFHVGSNIIFLMSLVVIIHIGISLSSTTKDK